MPNPFYFGSGIDLLGSTIFNVRLQSITGLVDLPTGDGAIGYMSANGNKRLAFRDTELGGLVQVPRLDRDEAVTGQYQFAPGSVQAPYTLSANAQGQKVIGLNADLLDGYHAAAAADPSTIAIRDGSGRMKAASPVADDDVATKSWSLDIISGILSRKGEARVAAKTNVDLSAPGSTIDGVTLTTDDRILLLGQTDPSENGLYNWNGAATPMTRTSDADADSEVNPGMTVWVSEGTQYGNTEWQLTTDDPITVDITPLDFVQSFGAGGVTAGSGMGVEGNEMFVKIGSAGDPAGSQYTAQAIVYADSTSTLAQLTLGSANTILGINAGGTAYEHKAIVGTANEIDVTHTSGQIQIGLINPLIPAKGGTGLATYVTGDLLYASGTTTLTTLASAVSGSVLLSGASAPAWGKVNLTGHVSGILPMANGGTNANLTAAAGGIAYSGASAIAINTPGTANQILVSGGTGAPVFRSATIDAAGKLLLTNNTATVYDPALIPFQGSPGQVITNANTGDNDNYVGLEMTVAGVSGGSAYGFIGVAKQTDYGDMVFGTRAADGFKERARLTSGGNFGLGTTAPGAKLHVYDGSIRVQDTTSGKTGILDIDTQSSGSRIHEVNSGRLTFEAYDYLIKGYTGTDYMCIKDGGNVGIGTTNPGAKLVVDQFGNAPTSYGTGVGLVVVNTQASGTISKISVLGGSAGMTGIEFGDASGLTQGSILYNNSGDSLSFGTNGTTDRLFINSTGNVGIGTTTPNLQAANKALTLSAGTSGDVKASFELQGFRTTDVNFCEINAYHAASNNAQIGFLRAGANDAADITFWTRSTGGSLTEKMRLTSGGSVNITGLTASQYVKTDASKNLVSVATIPWSDLSGVPATFTPSAHTHDAADINAGTLNASRLPTDLTAGTTIGGKPLAVVHSATVGNGVDTSYAITHNLQTEKVVFVGFKDTVNGQNGGVGWAVDSANQITVGFVDIPATDQMEIYIIAII